MTDVKTMTSEPIVVYQFIWLLPVMVWKYLLILSPFTQTTTGPTIIVFFDCPLLEFWRALWPTQIHHENKKEFNLPLITFLFLPQPPTSHIPTKQLTNINNPTSSLHQHRTPTTRPTSLIPSPLYLPHQVLTK